MPGGDNGHWSYSQVSTFLSCGLKYWFSSLSGKDPVSTSPSLILGQGLHAGYDLAYRGIQKGKVPALKEVVGVVAEEMLLRQKVSAPIKFGEAGSMDSLLDESHRLAEVLYKSIDREAQVVAVDLEQTVPLFDEQGREMAKPLQVVMDLVVKENGGEVVVDLKTSRQRFSEDKLLWDMQPTCYLYARSTSGQRGLSFRYDVLLKKAKNPEFVQYAGIRRSQKDVRQMVAIIKTIDRAIKAGIFLPNRGMFCSGCGYEPLCRDLPG